MKKRILEYLINTYHPEAIITYGSYSDGTANEYSDFDALLIAQCEAVHDGSAVDGVTLDVFICSPESLSAGYDPADLIQIHDGRIELDQNGSAAKLMESVTRYIDSLPFKTGAEVRQEMEWCRKMLSRTKREDAEGCFRWHLLLTESLEIYCDIMKIRYFGPKKALLKMAADDPEGYSVYQRALKHFDHEALADWLRHMENKLSQAEK